MRRKKEGKKGIKIDINKQTNSRRKKIILIGRKASKSILAHSLAEIRLILTVAMLLL